MFYSNITKGFYDGQHPDDAVEITDALHVELLAAQSHGKIISFDQATQLPVAIDPPPLTADQIISKFRLTIQNRINDFAATRLYDSVDSMSKYKDITDSEIQTLPSELRALVEKFRIETRYLALKTAETWAKSYLIIDQYQKKGSIPTEQELISQLPVLEWPN